MGLNQHQDIQTLDPRQLLKYAFFSCIKSITNEYCCLIPILDSEMGSDMPGDWIPKPGVSSRATQDQGPEVMDMTTGTGEPDTFLF